MHHKIITPDDVLSITEAAQRLNMTESNGQRVLRRIAAEGRIPFAQRLGRRWILTKDSLKFLQRHYHEKNRLNMRGGFGWQLVAKMSEEAARLDPACAERQRLSKKAAA